MIYFIQRNPIFAKSASFQKWWFCKKKLIWICSNSPRASTDTKMATINITTEFVPEIWEQIKEYAGIYHISTNIIHFDKLTFEELEDSIDGGGWRGEVPNPFALLYVNSIYSALVFGADCIDDGCDEPLFEYSGGKYFDKGKEIKTKEKKDMLVNVIITEYNNLRRRRWWDSKLFWNTMSEMITYHFKKRDETKAEAKKKRAAAKAIKETPKGMIAEINKIEDERRRLMKRMKDDEEKLNKLTTKGREWRKKLDKKRGNN